MKIVVGTKNQKKIDTVQAMFKEVFEVSELQVVAHDARSLVPEAPHDKETYDGAINRAKECAAIGGGNRQRRQRADRLL